jgi:drug/metabolite transporter (DMT)-like permease
MAFVYLGTTVFLWATQYWATEIAARHASPIVITALRAVPAAILLLLVCRFAGRSLPPRRTWPWIAVVGLMMVVVTLGGISEGAARAGAANTAVLINTSPFFIALFGRLFLGERVTWVGVMGLVVGFAGVVVMVSPQLGGTGDAGNLALGMGLALAGALGFAVGTLVVKWLTGRTERLDVVGLTAAQYAVGATALLLVAVAIEPVSSTEWGSGELWGAIAWIAVGASALGYTTYYAALERLPAASVGPWLFLIPVLAVVIDVGRGMSPDAIVLAGMALTVAGVAIVTVSAARAATRDPGEPARASPVGPAVAGTAESGLAAVDGEDRAQGRPGAR